MTPLNLLKESNEVRTIIQDLVMRCELRHEGGPKWSENLGKVLWPAARRYGELLEIAAAALPSENERMEMIEAAWRHFRPATIALSPEKEWPARRLGPLEADWTWLAFDNRGKGIRVDLATGKAAIISLRAAPAIGLDPKALNRASAHIPAGRRRAMARDKLRDNLPSPTRPNEEC